MDPLQNLLSTFQSCQECSSILSYVIQAQCTLIFLYKMEHKIKLHSTPLQNLLSTFQFRQACCSIFKVCNLGSKYLPLFSFVKYKQNQTSFNSIMEFLFYFAISYVNSFRTHICNRCSKNIIAAVRNFCTMAFARRSTQSRKSRSKGKVPKRKGQFNILLAYVTMKNPA